MSKTAPQASILTANRLKDGIAVFLDFEGAWSEDIREALVAHSPDELRALEDRGKYDAAHNLVVEPYLVEVREIDGRVIPVRYRERVRAGGPTILDDVPGYVAVPPSPRVSRTSPSASTTRGEGRGEGQQQTPSQASAPHPNPLPAGGERERAESLAKVA